MDFMTNLFYGSIMALWWVLGIFAIPFNVVAMMLGIL